MSPADVVEPLPPIESVHDALVELTWVVREAHELMTALPAPDAPDGAHAAWDARRRAHARLQARLLDRVAAERGGER